MVWKAKKQKHPPRALHPEFPHFDTPNFRGPGSPLEASISLLFDNLCAPLIKVAWKAKNHRGGWLKWPGRLQHPGALHSQFPHFDTPNFRAPGSPLEA